MSIEASPTTAQLGLRLPRGVTMAALAVSMFLIILDTSMVNLASLSIRTSLGLSAAELTLTVNSYLVAFAGLLLLGGRLADVLGPRRTFLAGMILYVAASAFCALATSGPLLITGRVGQGIGAAISIPSALALVLTLYTTPTERTRAMGIWGAVGGAGSLIGVFLGGVLTQALGWQSVFWTPVPLGIVSAIMVWRAVPAMPGRPGRFDLAGALTITVGISALALGMVSASEAGWTAASSIIGIAVGVVALAAFVLAEHRSPHPLVPLAVFRRRPVVTATVVMVLLGATLTSLFFFLPLYQQDVLGMSALTAGLAQIPIAVMIIVGSVLAPWLAKLLGVRSALHGALVLLLAGFLWLVLNPTTDGFSINLLGAFLLIGIGLGLGLVNAISMAVRDSGDGESGLLSGLVNAAQQLGGAVGLAALAGIAIAAGGDGGISFTAAFLGGAALIALALTLSVLLRIGDRSDPTTPYAG
ncbi:drug resistance transporter, EmrB/QacA subfamily [Promicromonospora umidemergens]|uniref:DHA2 family efflux MFS transporter permease subunit n=1 Tax=Promicromonospora umidemergens TaxID=629679 RepID=A0ABP8X5V8_9MICO|nr:MFS transporter [Promicromonospora umidemergens]MCP2281249.1 drug resistance transporter, EmrB/QacA subfamily [Promicromonospora umidemergens]